jgi:hypothetical protein
MANFTAKLIGESDGLTISRTFAEKAHAITWLQGVGLADFEDQTARGEVYSSDGTVVWAKSHLQSAGGMERDQRLADHRLLAKVGIKARY